MPQLIEVFFSYSHKDKELRDGLDKHLSLMKHLGIITGWHDHQISAGQEWKGQIDEHLNTAHVILLLVSADFLNSNYCYDIELTRAMERHAAGEARVIPIILRPCDWQGAPFDQLQVLPTDGKPVTEWPNLDQAFLDIARGIRDVVDKLCLSDQLLSLRNTIKISNDGGSEEWEEDAALLYEVTKPFEEIRQRLASMKSCEFEAFAITAHNLDVFHQVKSNIEPDHETRITKTEEHPGGSGANTIYALAKLGRKVGIAGIVAKDRNGRYLKEDFGQVERGKYKVDVECLLETNPKAGLHTGRTLVLVEKHGGRRLICVDPGVNEIWAEEIERQNQQGKLVDCISSSKIVHFSSFTGDAERAKQRRLIGYLPKETILSFTPGALYSGAGLDALEEILRRTNVLFLYEQQLDTLLRSKSLLRPKETAPHRQKLRRLFEWRKQNKHCEPILIVIKPAAKISMGISVPSDIVMAYGCNDFEGDILPKVRVEDSGRKDTTGAGDALASGVLFGLLRGSSVQFCVEAGVEMAACASSTFGARPGLPNVEGLRGRLL